MAPYAPLSSFATTNPRKSYLGTLATTAPKIDIPNQQYPMSSTSQNGNALTSGQFGVTPSSVGATTPQAPVITPARKAFTTSLATDQQQTSGVTQPIVPTVTPTSPIPPTGLTGTVQTPSGTTVNTGNGTTDPTTLGTPAPAPKVDNYANAYQAYISSLAPSAEETAATKNLNDLSLQARKDQETALNSGETQGFAAGEAARVNRNNSFAIDAASNAVNALTGQRTATTAQDKARVDYEQSLKTNTDAPYTLSEGQNRYDSTGKLIASGPTKTVAPTKRDTQVVNIGGQDVLVDTQTGARISTLGKAGNPTTTEAGTNLNALLSVTEAQALGVPYGTTRSQALGISPTKAPTADQSKAGGYADRINDANTTIDTLGSKFTGAFAGFGGLAPNQLKSDERQQLEQAETNFLTAKLRQESGAAIAQSEFDTAKKQYFPQPGDSAAVLAQKAQNRQSVLENLKKEAGPGSTLNGAVSPKGSQSDKSFVEKTLTKQKLDYNHIVSSAPQGQIAVIENSSGNVGYISPEEFKSSSYTRL